MTPPIVAVRPLSFKQVTTPENFAKFPGADVPLRKFASCANLPENPPSTRVPGARGACALKENLKAVAESPGAEGPRTPEPLTTIALDELEMVAPAFTGAATAIAASAKANP